MAAWENPYTEARRDALEAEISRLRESADVRLLVEKLLDLAHLVKWVVREGDPPVGTCSVTLAEEAEALARSIDAADLRVRAIAMQLPFGRDISAALDEMDTLAAASAGLGSLALAAEMRGRHDRTNLQASELALRYYTELGSERGQARCHFTLGLQAADEATKAAHALRAAEIYSKHGIWHDAGMALLLAQINLATDDPRRRECVEQRLQLAERMGRISVGAHAAMLEYAWLDGDEAEAERHTRAILAWPGDEFDTPEALTKSWMEQATTHRAAWRSLRRRMRREKR